MFTPVNFGQIFSFLFFDSCDNQTIVGFALSPSTSTSQSGWGNNSRAAICWRSHVSQGGCTSKRNAHVLYVLSVLYGSILLLPLRCPQQGWMNLSSCKHSSEAYLFQASQKELCFVLAFDLQQQETFSFFISI